MLSIGSTATKQSLFLLINDMASFLSYGIIAERSSAYSPAGQASVRWRTEHDSARKPRFSRAVSKNRKSDQADYAPTRPQG